jgi:hypothetical protein
MSKKANKKIQLIAKYVAIFAKSAKISPDKFAGHVVVRSVK